MSCRAVRPLLAEAALASPDAATPAELARHLEHCPACTAELAALRAAVTVLDTARPLPRPPSDVWARLAPALDAADAARAQRLAWWRLAPLPVRLAAAAVLAVAVASTTMLLTRRQAPAPESQAAAAAPLDEEVRRYLERATPLLVALANRDAGASPAAFDAVAERRAARALAEDGRALAAALREARHARDGALVSDIVVLCMQLGNSSGARYGASVALARDGIARRDLLFALSVRELRRAETRLPPVRTPIEETT